MVKVSRRYVDPKDFGHYVNNLWSAFTLMDSKEDIRLLFKDLFTHTEYKMFAKRLEIARRLLLGQTYEEIGEALKVTAHTITSINNILNSSGEGLRKADRKLKDLEKQYQRYREERQMILERRAWPKYKGVESNALPKLVKAGVSAIDKSISHAVKRRSAGKALTV